MNYVKIISKSNQDLNLNVFSPIVGDNQVAVGLAIVTDIPDGDVIGEYNTDNYTLKLYIKCQFCGRTCNKHKKPYTKHSLKDHVNANHHKEKNKK
jgi:hypothetical protein